MSIKIISKKVLALFLAVVMVFSLSMLVPQTTQQVYAAETNSQLNLASNPSTGSGSGWSWVGGTTKTLTLNGLDLKYNTNSAAVTLPAGTTIVLKGNNSIRNGIVTGAEKNGIKSYGNLTIKGSGKLSIETDNNCIGTDGDIIVKDGKLNLKSNRNSTGFHSKGNIIIDGGSITIAGAVYMFNSMKINGGSLDITSGNFFGIRTRDGGIFINGGSGTVKTLTNTHVAMVSNTKKLTVKKGMKVFGWDGKAYTKRTIAGTHVYEGSTLHTFADAATKKAHLNLKFVENRLSKPTKFKVTKNKTSWKNVKNNSGYTLTVKQGTKTIFKKQIKKNKTSYKFTAKELKKFKKGKKYTFTLVAKGKGNFRNSPDAKVKNKKMK